MATPTEKPARSLPESFGQYDGEVNTGLNTQEQSQIENEEAFEKAGDPENSEALSRYGNSLLNLREYLKDRNLNIEVGISKEFTPLTMTTEDLDSLIFAIENVSSQLKEDNSSALTKILFTKAGAGVVKDGDILRIPMGSTESDISEAIGMEDRPSTLDGELMDTFKHEPKVGEEPRGLKDEEESSDLSNLSKALDAYNSLPNEEEKVEDQDEAPEIKERKARVDEVMVAVEAKKNGEGVPKPEKVNQRIGRDSEVVEDGIEIKEEGRLDKLREERVHDDLRKNFGRNTFGNQIISTEYDELLAQKAEEIKARIINKYSKEGLTYNSAVGQEIANAVAEEITIPEEKKRNELIQKIREDEAKANPSIAEKLNKWVGVKKKSLEKLKSLTSSRRLQAIAQIVALGTASLAIGGTYLSSRKGDFKAKPAVSGRVFVQEGNWSAGVRTPGMEAMGEGFEGELVSPERKDGQLFVSSTGSELEEDKNQVTTEAPKQEVEKSLFSDPSVKQVRVSQGTGEWHDLRKIFGNLGDYNNLNKYQQTWFLATTLEDIREMGPEKSGVKIGSLRMPGEVADYTRALADESKIRERLEKAKNLSQAIQDSIAENMKRLEKQEVQSPSLTLEEGGSTQEVEPVANNIGNDTETKPAPSVSSDVLKAEIAQAKSGLPKVRSPKYDEKMVGLMAQERYKREEDDGEFEKHKNDDLDSVYGKDKKVWDDIKGLNYEQVMSYLSKDGGGNLPPEIQDKIKTNFEKHQKMMQAIGGLALASGMLPKSNDTVESYYDTMGKHMLNQHRNT